MLLTMSLTSVFIYMLNLHTIAHAESSRPILSIEAEHFPTGRATVYFQR